MPLHRYCSLNSEGFTIIEIVIVLSLISILAVFTGQVYVLASKYMSTWEYQFKINNDLIQINNILNEDLLHSNRIVLIKGNELIIFSSLDTIFYSLEDSIFFRNEKVFSSNLLVSKMNLQLYHENKVDFLELPPIEQSTEKSFQVESLDFVEYTIDCCTCRTSKKKYTIKDAVRTKYHGWSDE